MAGIQVDSERLMLREVDKSLSEWGRWSSRGGRPHLGYPSEWPVSRVRGRNADDRYDMKRVQEIEFGFTTWMMYTKISTQGAVRRHNMMLLFILRLHYTEPGSAADKAHHVSRMFRRKVGRSQYYVLLREARLKLATLIY